MSPSRFDPGTSGAVARARVPAHALLLVGTVALLAAGCARNPPLRTFEQETRSTIALAPQVALAIETDLADIRLAPSPDDSVRVVTWKRVQSISERSVETLARQIRVTMERVGDSLILRVREPERASKRVYVQVGPWKFRREVEVALTVQVPARARLAVRTERGDITGESLAQGLVVRTASGDVELSDVKGPVYLRTASGDAVLARVAGVAVESASGDLMATDVEGGFRFATASGDIEATRVSGAANGETSTGDVRLVEVKGSTRVLTRSGDAAVSAAGDTVTVDSASGDLEVEVLGPARHVDVQTASGDVVLTLSRKAGSRFDAQTASGSMRVTGPFQYDTMNRHQLTGRLDGRGDVRVRTSSGDIEVAMTVEAAP